MIVLTVPVVVKSEMNLREHWRARKKRWDAQRAAVRLMAQARGVHAKTELPAAVRLVRMGRRFLDDDNLAGAFKAVRDELAAVLFGVPSSEGCRVDNDPRVTWVYAQELVTKKHDEGIRLEIQWIGGDQ